MNVRRQSLTKKTRRVRLFNAKLRYFFAKSYFVIKNYRNAKLLFRRPFVQSLIFILHMRRFEAVYKDGRKLYSHNFWKFYVLKAKEYDFHVEDITIKHAEIGACEEIFSGEYESLTVANKIVVDIGASIGDTPIYFAMKGAKKVIAIESDPIRFKYLEENVKNSRFANLIELLNFRLVNEHEPTQLLKSSDSINLKQILQMFDIKENAVMKIDCEGCEYDTILKEDSITLSKFIHIVGEYHYDYLCLKKKLESSGFMTRFTKPTYFYDPTKDNPECLIGNFMAWK